METIKTEKLFDKAYVIISLLPIIYVISQIMKWLLMPDSMKTMLGSIAVAIYIVGFSSALGTIILISSFLRKANLTLNPIAITLNIIYVMIITNCLL